MIGFLVLTRNWLRSIKPEKKELLVMGGVLVVSGFFRLYRLKDLFFFSLDEEVIAFQVRQIITGVHFPAIGVNAADTGLYLGPFYFYLAGPFFWIFRGEPVAGAVLAALIGVVTTGIVFKVGERLFSFGVGAVAALIHSISLPVVLFERKFFNPTPGILISALILWCLAEIKIGRRQYWYGLVLCLGAILHINLAFGVYFVIAALWLWRSRFRPTRREIIGGMIALGIFVWPLVFFDLRHQWFLSKEVISTLESGSKTLNLSSIKVMKPLVFLSKVPLMHLASSNVIDEFSTGPAVTKNLPSGLGIGLLIASGLWLVGTKKNINLKLMITALLISGLALGMYPGFVQEYYGMVMVVPYLLLLARFLKAYSLVGGVVVATLIMLNMIQLVTIYNPHGLKRLEALRSKILQETKGQKLNLLRAGSANYGWGMTYLLTQRGYPPNASFEDPILGFLYQHEKTKADEENFLVFVVSTRESIDAWIVP